MEIPQEDKSGEISSKSKRVRGLTRLAKLRKKFKDFEGLKHMIEFDEPGKFKAKQRSEIYSFLGDLVRREVGLEEL